ncbi:MAG: TOBE domain-containing protein [Thermoleophilia bacterium]|nr:TOBE domain-containing protein [Thermoleophilia bacterium]
MDTALGAFALLGSVVGPVRVFIRPELVGVARDQTGSAVVESRDFRGHDVVYGLRLSDGSLTWAHRPSIDMVDVGDRVRIDPQPGHAALVPVAWDTPPT